MPNNVTNRMVVTGELAAVDAFKKRCIVTGTDIDSSTKEEKTWAGFNFRALVPIPDELPNTVVGTSAENGMHILAYYKGDPKPLESMLNWPWVKEARITCVEKLKDALLERSPGCVAEAERQLSNIEIYGHVTCRDWACENWGTDRNAYSFREIGDNPGRYDFSFDTAWVPPVPIFRKLAVEFPNLTFEIVCVEEFGQFGGEGSIKDGYVRFHKVQANDELYEKVYGSLPEKYDDPGY